MQPTDGVDYNHPQLVVVSKLLHLKHPDVSVPPASILSSLNDLPYLKDNKVTDFPIRCVASELQDDAGPGEFDASHCRNILLRFGCSTT